MIELCGSQDSPFLQPFLVAAGEKSRLKTYIGARGTSLDSHVYHDGRSTCSGRHHSRAMEERGFGYRILVRNTGCAADVKIGLRGTWGSTMHSINESKPICCEKALYPSGWNHCYVMDLRPGLSLFAFAPIYTETPETCPVQSHFQKQGETIQYQIALSTTLEQGGRESVLRLVWRRL